MKNYSQNATLVELLAKIDDHHLLQILGRKESFSLINSVFQLRNVDGIYDFTVLELLDELIELFSTNSEVKEMYTKVSMNNSVTETQHLTYESEMQIIPYPNKRFATHFFLSRVLSLECSPDPRSDIERLIKSTDGCLICVMHIDMHRMKISPRSVKHYTTQGLKGLESRDVRESLMDFSGSRTKLSMILSSLRY